MHILEIGKFYFYSRLYVLLEAGFTSNVNIYKFSPRCYSAPVIHRRTMEGSFENFKSQKNCKSLSLFVPQLRVKVGDVVYGSGMDHRNTQHGSGQRVKN